MDTRPEAVQDRPVTAGLNGGAGGDAAAARAAGMDRGPRSSTLSTIVVMACTAFSRLFGFIKQALIASVFGATGPADALNAVFNIPNNLRKLYAEGAFSSAFIPVLSTSILEDQTGKESRRLVESLMAFQLIILGPMVILGLIFPDQCVQLLLKFSDASKMPIAADLFRWMFNYTLLVSLSALIMAVLNSHGRFAVPALSPLIFSLAIVLSIVFLARRLGVISMGIGVLVGGVLQLIFQIPSFLRRGYRLTLRFDFRNPRFIQTVKLWIPYLASASIFTINQLLANYFASSITDGGVSALSNSVMFLQIPLGVFAASVMTVVFPKMSRQATVQDLGGLRDSLTYGIEALVIFLVPSSVVLCLLGKEGISVVLQRGAFTSRSTFMTSQVLIGYAIGLVSMGIYNMLQRLFYSLKEFRTPIISAGIVAVVDLCFSLILKETALRVTGLAVANSIAFTAGDVYLIILARRRLGRLGAKRISVSFLKAVLASAPMAAFLVAFTMWKGDLWAAGFSFPLLGWVVAALAVSGALLVAMFFILRVSFVTDLIKRRLR